jgi:hypothetical protein
MRSMVGGDAGRASTVPSKALSLWQMGDRETWLQCPAMARPIEVRSASVAGTT